MGVGGKVWVRARGKVRVKGRVGADGCVSIERVRYSREGMLYLDRRKMVSFSLREYRGEASTHPCRLKESTCVSFFPQPAS